MSQTPSSKNSGTPAGKGRPTRTRKEAEALRKRPLVVDKKEARKLERAKRDELFARQSEALKTGDDRYLPARDKGPVRRFIRDWVDARFNLGEIFLPVAFTLILISYGYQLIVGRMAPAWLILTIWSYMLVAIADAIMLGRKVNGIVKKKFRAADIPARTGWYVFTRAFNIRRFRSPRPQVQRGKYPKI